jgi:hypothetical protein
LSLAEQKKQIVLKKHGTAHLRFHSVLLQALQLSETGQLFSCFSEIMACRAKRL